MEKEDLPLILEWTNNLEFGGEYEPIEQMGMKEFEGLTLLAKDHRDKYHKGEETFESDANPPNARELLQGALFANA